ncbi:MAG: hypothetical protein IPK67_19510 [Planctomycetes bacterium]|nr:hypothetical protein [Planctomycetota bacterium]
MGRSVLRVDMGSGAQVWRCGELVLLEDEALPSLRSAARHGARRHRRQGGRLPGAARREGVPVVFVTSNAEYGARWMRAASLLAQGPTPEQGLARVRELLGSGLAGTAFPDATP